MTADKCSEVILKMIVCEWLVGHASHGWVGRSLRGKVPMIVLNHFSKSFVSADEEQTTNL